MRAALLPTQGGTVVRRILELLDAHGGQPPLEAEARAVADAYGPLGSGPLPGTTHISVIDADGLAAGLSSTLGSGSGVFRGGTQLNNMLGELDVIGTDEKAPGDRLASMMTPRRARAGQPQLVIGSAGSVRLAGAIAQVTWRFLSGTHVADAIRGPRLHVEGATLHLEGGWPDVEVAALPPTWDVNRWDGLNLFFGGVQAVERTAGLTFEAAGDPRRGGHGDRRRVTTVRRATPQRRARPRRARRERRARGRALDPRDGALASPADERRYLRTIQGYPDAAVFVAEDAGRIVGRLSLARDPHPASRHVADLGLMVAVGHRRRGVGTALLHAAVAWARDAGIRKLELHVFPWNEPALALYEAFGFEREGYRKRHYERGGELVDAILMAYFVEMA